MAINSYAALKTAIASYLHRDDLTAMIPTFIALAESDIASDIADLPQLLTRATATTAAGNPLIDTLGMYALRDAWHDGEPIAILHPNSVPASGTDTGRPQGICIEGDAQLRVYPTPDGAYEIDVLYVPIISPSMAGGEPDDAATNWILQQHLGCYLYGALLHSAPFIQDQGTVQLWQVAYETSINRLRATNKGGHTTGRADALVGITRLGGRYYV